MLSVTIAHHRGERLARLLNGVVKAWRRTRQGGSVQELWKRHVTASVRASEQTWSPKNGWHPHLHVLLRTDEWSDDDKATLLERFRACVLHVLGPENVPSVERAIVWSEPFDLCKGDELGDREHRLTRYLFKLGLEVTSLHKATRQKKGKTPWQLADDGCRGNELAKSLWLEYCEATRGKRMIELDDRAQWFAKQPSTEIDPVLHESTVERIVIPVDSIELRGLRDYERTFDPAILAKMLNDASRSVCPKTVVKTWIDLALPRLRYTPDDGDGTETQTEARSYTSYFDAPEARDTS
jgi:hypothetical protein